MSENDEKALKEICKQLSARLQHQIGRPLDPEALERAVRQMTIELFPIRVVDTKVDPDGQTIHCRIEMPLRLRLNEDPRRGEA